MYAIKAVAKRRGDALGGSPSPRTQRDGRKAKRSGGHQAIDIHGFAFAGMNDDRHAITDQD